MLNPKFILLLASLFVSAGAFADSSGNILRDADENIHRRNLADTKKPLHFSWGYAPPREPQSSVGNEILIHPTFGILQDRSGTSKVPATCSKLPRVELRKALVHTNWQINIFNNQENQNDKI